MLIVSRLAVNSLECTWMDAGVVGWEGRCWVGGMGGCECVDWCGWVGGWVPRGWLETVTLLIIQTVRWKLFPSW